MRVPAWLALVPLLSACAELPREVRSPLVPARMSPDSVALDIFWVRLPPSAADLESSLWLELDEQHLAAATRRQLGLNGFRAGLTGELIPLALERLVKSAGNAEFEVSTQISDFSQVPVVRRRYLQLRAGHENQIVATETVPRLPVLYHDGSHVGGQTYHEAQGLFVLKAFPQGDGRVRIELVPEVHHGQPKQRYVPGEGMYRVDFSRPSESYERLRIDAVLAPGNMLFVGSTPDGLGTLGHHFFCTSGDGTATRKLLILRLAQTQHDDLFAAEHAELVERSPAP